jgi:hypothetical protein
MPLTSEKLGPQAISSCNPMPARWELAHVACIRRCCAVKQCVLCALFMWPALLHCGCVACCVPWHCRREYGVGMQ